MKKRAFLLLMSLLLTMTVAGCRPGGPPSDPSAVSVMPDSSDPALWEEESGLSALESSSSASVGQNIADSSAQASQPAPSSAPPSSAPAAEGSLPAVSSPAAAVSSHPQVTSKEPEPADPVSILYVGNSFVQVGNVPAQVSALAAMYGIPVDYVDLSKGGATLRDSKQTALLYLEMYEYDYAVFQDYGTRQADDPQGFEADMDELCAAAVQAGAQPVLYNPAWSNDGARPDRMYQEEQTAAYRKAAQKNDAILVNAGDAWVYAYDTLPDLSLYRPGDYHANDTGAYLTACVFVSTLFGIQVRDVCPYNLYRGDLALPLAKAAWEFVSSAG